jgi:hypothetical protein
MTDNDTGSQKRFANEFRPAEYDLEERMNHNLMKQFKGMFDGDEAGIAAQNTQNKNGY